MADQNLKEVYDQILKEVSKHPEVQGRGRGLLHKTIQIILGEEDSDVQGNSQEICEQFGITSSADENSDFEILAKVNEIFIDRFPSPEGMNSNPIFSQVKSFVTSGSTRISQLFSSKEKKMEWIILAACTLIGLYYSRKWLQNAQPNRLLGGERVRQQPTLPPPIPAALCLIVPAYVVSKLYKDSNLEVGELIELIDNTSYFLCTNPKEATLNEESLLELTNEDILPDTDSQREVYLRVDINDGRDLIGKKIPYILKTNLPANAQFIIKKRNCLKDLSGLEKFNRV
ncbi:MAG TPA: hypothetical protein V6C84_30160 [Coleofasciculaceae cyanobacterium]